MFEPIDAQLGAARRLGVEIVRHRDEARDERLIAPESDRIAAVDRDDRDRRTRALPRRRDEGLERGGDFARAGIFPRDDLAGRAVAVDRSEEHTSELQSLMRNSYAVFCL